MVDKAKTDLKSLEAKLGYVFTNQDTLRTSLTHSSARIREPRSRDNERLEFLGDRVLGLAIAELLSERYPDATEGELARRFNRLVRKETCADVARAIDLGGYVVMSGGEHESGGRAKTTILGDACEAVLGAIFIDGGFPPARQMIRDHWLGILAGQDRVPADAKSTLQEWAQGRGMPLPRYDEVERQGPDHAPVFTAEVIIDNIEPGRGSGASKRTAEQAAAAAVLVREGVWDSIPDE